MRLINRSKKYVAVLLGGGIPNGIDKSMELIADRKKRISFVYGLNVFVLYFSSKKGVDEIRNILSVLVNENVDMVFVFRNDKNLVEYVSETLRLRVDNSIIDRGGAIELDIDALKNVLDAMGGKYVTPNIPIIENNIPEQEPTEKSLSDDDILNDLIMKIKINGKSSLSPAEIDFLAEYNKKHKKNNPKDQQDVD